MDHDSQVELRLAELLADRPQNVTDVAIAARRFVAKLAGEASELLYATYAVSCVFSYSGKLGEAFIHVATYAGHVNLGFNRGAELPDPAGLLAGTGVRIRHIRLDKLEDLKTAAIKKLVAAAIQQGRAAVEELGCRCDRRIVDKSK